MIQLEALSVALTGQRIEHTPAARSAFLPRWLEAQAWAELGKLRGGAGSDEAQDRHEQRGALDALKTDFHASNRDRESWGILWFYYCSGSSLTIRELTRELDLGYNTLRRRIDRGCQLFVDLLEREERRARSAVSQGRRVPRPLTSFIGRETELGAIRATMARHRLVTLTGPGGIGKSRLALRIANDLASEYPDGAWFVELANVDLERDVPKAVSSTLGLSEVPGRKIIDVLRDSLSEKRLLLVLDNCEHLAEACSRLVTELLSASDALSVLATSREELRVEGGAVWQVPPMSLPPAASPPATHAVIHADATRLFRSRAKHVRPDFQVTERNAAQIWRICAKLEAIPLAIELTAEKARFLTLEQLESRLNDRFELLVDGSSPRPSHEALEAVLEWSHSLLDSEERALLRRATVFRGGWTLEQAEAVASGEDLPEHRMLDVLSRLVSKSMIIATWNETELRYGMLETIREFAARRLSGRGEVEALRDRHLQHFMSWAENANANLGGPDQRHWLDRMELERPNVRAALTWAADSQRIEEGSRLGNAMLDYWQMRGHWEEGWSPMKALVSCPDARERSPIRERLLTTFGILTYLCGDLGGSESVMNEALRVCKALGLRDREARVRNMLAIIGEDRADFEAARRHYEQALAIGRENGDDKRVAATLHNLGGMATRLGDFERGAELIEASLEIEREIGNPLSRAQSLHELANCYSRIWYQEVLKPDASRTSNASDESESLRKALRNAEECLEIAREIDAPAIESNSLNLMGNVAYRRHDFDAARALLEESLSIQRRLKQDRNINGHLVLLGLIDALDGRLDHAQELLLASLNVAIGIEYAEGLGESIGALAVLEACRGDGPRSTRLAALSDAILGRIQAERVDHALAAEGLREARTAAGARLVEEATAVAAEVSVDLAVGYALRERDWESLSGSSPTRAPA